MTAFLYDQAFLHWDDHLPIGLPQLVLQDGYGAHYNVTTLLRLANRTGHCDGELYRQDGPGRVYVLTYPPALTRLIAPPDHSACFGAFQRARHRLMTEAGGVAELAQLFHMAGTAYARTFSEHNVHDAFRWCGFTTGPERLMRQRHFVGVLEQYLAAQAWLDQHGREHVILRRLARPVGLGADVQRPPRVRLGVGTKTIGVINDDDNIVALVRELHRIKAANAKAQAKRTDADRKRPSAKRSKR